MAQLASFEEMYHLMECASRRYPEITLTSKNAKEFESRCYEINVCERIITSIMDDLFFPPEDIIFSQLLTAETEKRYFKKNKKRYDYIEREIEVINYLYQELKNYRGESESWKSKPSER